MSDRKTVMSWLEGLAQDDWAEWHSDSEVQTTAQAALDLLKEQESDEKNKEYIKDKIAVECLNALQTINKYIDYEEDECGCSFWRDKKGYEFKTDIDYFFEGLDNFEEYLKRRLGQAVKWNDNQT